MDWNLYIKQDIMLQIYIIIPDSIVTDKLTSL